MPIDSEARALMLELSLPLDPPRRDAFLAAVTERLEASPAIGPGVVMAAGVSCNGSSSMLRICTAAKQGGGFRLGTSRERKQGQP
jgi:hypothetical protein